MPISLSLTKYAPYDQFKNHLHFECIDIFMASEFNYVTPRTNRPIPSP